MTLDFATFTDPQRDAARDRRLPLAVTAGAGSGKTRALVGRYAALLESGCDPEQVVAITFTDKAAREMRSRIRAAIEGWLPEPAGGEFDAETPVGGVNWEAAYIGLDAAPIGTIHSLCTNILRSHAAEAGVDPAFEVLDEGRAALLRAEAVESALAWAAADSRVVQLFDWYGVRELRSAVARLLEHRHDAEAAISRCGPDPLAAWRVAEAELFTSFLADRQVVEAFAALEALRRDGRVAAAGDTLAERIGGLLAAWAEIATAWPLGDLATTAEVLARFPGLFKGGAGQQSRWPDIEQPRAAVGAIRERYTEVLGVLKLNAGDAALDARAALVVPLLAEVFAVARRVYRSARERRGALDFDDLEARSAALLTDNPSVRAAWQARVQALLVDEFQDTNARQQSIVYALVGLDPTGPVRRADQVEGATSIDISRDILVARLGEGPRLLIVGDARQSIYRFRGADVAVFAQARRDVLAVGGEPLVLAETFRAHRSLVASLNALVGPAVAVPRADSAVPGEDFADLVAHRAGPRGPHHAPFVELRLGLAEQAPAGRRAAAEALARRLGELVATEGFGWSQIALLFRAATGFPAYEDALEAAGIPFVTVAGRGFYHRPEVRDVLAALRALADPTDDTAMAGLLRSPAIGLSDAGLYRLRRGEDGQLRGLSAALRSAKELLDPGDAEAAERARLIVTELGDLVGRVPVAEVLARWIERTQLRAILAAPPSGSRRSARSARNLEKLLADVHASRLVNIDEFLAHLAALRDVAAREGEAPVEAGAAVQLMTIHKAKGLEFPVVVLADASWKPPPGTDRLLFDRSLGLVPDLREEEARPLAYRLAARWESEARSAEDGRLLYVAATRASERLIVSGHVKLSTAKEKRGALLAEGWLAELGERVGLLDLRLDPPPSTEVSIELGDLGGEPVGCVVCPLAEPGGLREHLGTAQVDQAWAGTPHEPVLTPPRLADPLPVTVDEVLDDPLLARESDPPPRVWRVVPVARRPAGPAWVVGNVVHAALARWCFPDDPGFAALAAATALKAGEIDPDAARATLRSAARLLARFRDHALATDLDGAERQHEVPFTLEQDGRPESGVIDLLARIDGAWRVFDFKTDELRDEAALLAAVDRYEPQLRRYLAAVERLLGGPVYGTLVLLDGPGRQVLLRGVGAARPGGGH